MDKIREKIRQSAVSYKQDAEVSRFVEEFRARFGRNLAAIIFYGSCLTDKMRKPTSFRDFFVLVDDYSPMAKGILDKALLKWMPPNLYFMTIEDEGGKIEGKYHLLTLKEFRRLCARRAPDHYIIGRMCKRTALLWSKEEQTRDAVIDSLADAFYANAAVTLPLLAEPVDFQGLVLSFLRTSYKSELRMERDEKIEQIYQSEKQLYDELYSLLADNLLGDGSLALENGLYRLKESNFGERLLRKGYLLKSKVRHIARFPKMIMAMDNWLEQLLGKYERTYGERPEIKNWELWLWPITMARYLLKMRAKGRKQTHPG